MRSTSEPVTRLASSPSCDFLPVLLLIGEMWFMWTITDVWSRGRPLGRPYNPQIILRRDDYLGLRPWVVFAHVRVFARFVEGDGAGLERAHARRRPRAVFGRDRVGDSAVVDPAHGGAGLDAHAVRIEGVLVDIHARAAGGVVADVARDFDLVRVGDRAVEEGRHGTRRGLGLRLRLD